MRAEVSIAVNFVLSFLYNRMPRRRVNLFGEQLDCNLMAKFQGHWYPEQPLKGTAFRCLKISGEQSDPILLDAARDTGLEPAELMKHLPQNLTLWIDPGEVSCRVGEKGAVTQLYSSENPTADAECPEQQVQLTEPVADPTWAHQPRQQLGGGHRYTAADFAQTKFGSTKLRQPPRSHGFKQNSHLQLTDKQQAWQLHQFQQHWGWGLQQQQQQQHWLPSYHPFQPQYSHQQYQQQQQEFSSEIWSCDGLSVAIPSPATTMASLSAGSAGSSAESSGHSSPMMISK